MGLAFVVGCAGDDPPAVDATPPETQRLIPPGDPDYDALELPEAPGECAVIDDCRASCEYSCAPVPTGPTTCPIVPIPEPARVQGAKCDCLNGSVCAWAP